MSSCIHFVNSLNPVRTIVGSQFLGQLVVIIPRWLGKFPLAIKMKERGRACAFDYFFMPSEDREVLDAWGFLACCGFGS